MSGKIKASSSFWDPDRLEEVPLGHQSEQRALDRLRNLYTLSLSKLKHHEDKYTDLNYKPTPFKLRWLRGYNLRPGFINLTTDKATVIFYAAFNCGVLFNWRLNQEKILQGHKHGVTNIDSDQEGKWLLTADSGPENCVIIWDSIEYYPHRTIFNPHGPVPIAKVGISRDAKYILTMAYVDKVVVLHWWIWSEGIDVPHAKLTTEIPEGSIAQISFNPGNSTQFVVMTSQHLWIGAAIKVVQEELVLVKETEDYELKLKQPETLNAHDYGKLVCFTFVVSTGQIIAGTSKGYLMVFGYSIEYTISADSSNHENLRFIKVLKIQNERINVIKSIDGCIVTGSKNGDINFYDNQLKMIYRIQGFHVETIKAISFNRNPRSYEILDPKCKKKCYCWDQLKTVVDPATGNKVQKLMKHKLPTASTVEGKPVVIRDFVLTVGNDGIVYCDFTTETLEHVVYIQPSCINTITLHPDKPLIATGNDNGVVDIWMCEAHTLFRRAHLRQYFKVVMPADDDSIHYKMEEFIPEFSVTCLKYAPSGLHLACGLNTGQIMFLNPTTLEVISDKTLKDTSFAINKMEYNHDSTLLATGDIGKTVCVYKFSCETKHWSFVGKHRAHYKPITCLLFVPNAENEESKLISIGEDRMMAEYDIAASSNEALAIKSLDRIEQTAQPLAATVWPDPDYLNPEKHNTKLPLLLMANSEFKYKIINHSTAMTLATVLGPRFDHPVNFIKIVTIKKDDKDVQYIIFTTTLIIGIQKLPLDGNPWKYTALIGQPNTITDVLFRPETGMLYTIGQESNCISQWEADFSVIDKIEEQGGDELEPYYCLIEDGRPGWLFQEIRDLFYYIQILCQGSFSPAMRRVKDVIPIDSLPDMMRALGFYLSQFEVENLLAEAKYQVYRKEPQTEIDFTEFVKLYINHRPAFGVKHKDIYNAFKHFAKIKEDEYVIERERFLNVLRENGECFSPEVSWYLLSILFGHSFEDRANMEKEDFSFLPENINYQTFIHDVIGVSDSQLDFDHHSLKDLAHYSDADSH